MTTILPPSIPNDRAQVYSAHLQLSLLPELEVTRHTLNKIEYDISEYEQLIDKIEQLEKIDENGLETLSELGAGLFVETRISNTKQITLDLGFDLHLDMTLNESKGFIKKKIEILKKKRDNLSQKEEFLVWQVGQFHGALSQPQ